MGKKQKIKGKLAVGLFVDGQSLQVACLARMGEKIKLLDAQIVRLTDSQPVQMPEPQLAGEMVAENFSEPVDLSPELKELDLDLASESADEEKQENSQSLYRILSEYGKKKFLLGLSVAEPEVYFAQFKTDWGLQGKKLRQRIYDELLLEKPDIPVQILERLQTFPLKDGGLLVVIPETDLQVLRLLELSYRQARKRVPKIRYLEPAEFSLLRLIRYNYRFEDNEISAVIHVGHDFTRILFLQGNHLWHIAPLITEGLDSYNIEHTVYSRFLLASDNFNLPRVDNIILTGEAYEAGIKPFLRQKFPPDVDIDYVRFTNLEISGLDPLMARFALPIGNALRMLVPTLEPQYNLDLMPREFRERQKLFKLGLTGWVLLAILPVSTFYTTMEAQKQLQAVQTLEYQLKNKKQELHQLEGPRQTLEKLQNRLNAYDHVLNTLDRMLEGTERWSSFLRKLAVVKKRVGKIWVTDVRGSADERVVLHGYSLYRSRIPRFADAFPNSKLRKVEVQDIRGKNVYFFELAVPFAEPPNKEE